MKCKYCNEELSDSVKFCPNCGAETGFRDTGMPGVGENPPAPAPLDYSGWDSGDSKDEKPHTGWTALGDGELSSSGSGSSYSGERESPCYVNFGEAIVLYFKNYVNFRGRSTRSEYWFAFLFTYLASNAASIIDREVGIYIFSSIVSLATLLPSIAVACRRMHDIGKSAATYVIGFVLTIVWLIAMFASFVSAFGTNLDPNVMAKRLEAGGSWAPFAITCLCGLIPFAYGIYMVVLFAKPSQMTDNEYGRAPK